ncbi:Abi family protein [Glycomyces sp. NPDC021274]|uniref:Abi family protein n=1 Tax=Glycomyces sp. NPDC021274 TaxID=3155120 RepID=UPI0033D37DF0
MEEQVALLMERGLTVSDKAVCAAFLAANNYYRFSGFARHFQRAPGEGENSFRAGTTFGEIRAIYEADEDFRAELGRPLTRIELLLRAHTAHVIAEQYGPCGQYLEEDFYTDFSGREPTVDRCIRDIQRSRERHILHFMPDQDNPDFSDLPVWSAIEAWSFGTVSKCIERGARGALQEAVAASLGITKTGFANRVRSFVYLRNRCAHHGRLWHHSIMDAGPTPAKVRTSARKLVGQFDSRSVLDVIASLDDMLATNTNEEPMLPKLAAQHPQVSEFWQGLARPRDSQSLPTPALQRPQEQSKNSLSVRPTRSI